MRVNIRLTIGTGLTYSFDVEPSTTVRDLKNRLCERAGLYYNDDQYINTVLRYNNDYLVNEFRTLADSEVEDDAHMEFRDISMNFTRNINCGFAFVDLTDDKGLKRVEWSKTAPRWRVAGRGLCLEGICKNKDCQAFKQQVVIAIGYKQIDLFKEFSSVSRCPICGRFVKPIQCAFNNCQWRYTGVKQSSEAEDEEPVKVSRDWTYADDAYHYFDNRDGSTATWFELILYAKEK